MLDWEQLRSMSQTFWGYLPHDGWPDAWVAGSVTLFIGVVIAFWGAKLLRPLFALIFVGCGAWFGGEIGLLFGLSDIIGMVVGAVVMGLIGYILYRLWIAGMSAVLLAVVAVTIFGTRAALPYWSDYQAITPSDEFIAQYVVESGAPRSGWDTVTTLSKDFWTHLTLTHGDVSQKSKVIMLAGAALGFILGLMAERFATILWTSALGVVVAACGSVTLALHIWPTFRDSLWAYPQWVGVVILGLWLLAISIQSQGPRRIADLAGGHAPG
jgi:hypothetical protein